MSYVQFRDVGADLTPDVDRLTIDMPNDLKTWKEIVSRHPIVVLYVWRQSCNPCVMLKNRYEKWVHEIKQRYNDYNNTILFVKDCLDRDGPMPPEGTPSAVHNRMANMVPYFIIYYNNSIVFRHTGFETKHLEGYIDVCMSEYLESVQNLQNQQNQQNQSPASIPAASSTAAPDNVNNANIQYYQQPLP